MNAYDNTETPPRVAEIKGKVVHKESGVGIPDLIVQVFDVDPSTPLHNLFARASNDPLHTQRVGSVLTDQKGEFALSYLPDDLRAGDRQTGRPDLLLAVFAPDEPEAPQGPRSLYVDPEVRRDAAVTEQYIVRLPADRLAAAGVPLPSVPAQDVEGAGLVVERLLQADDRQTAIDDEGLRGIEKRHTHRVRQRSSDFEKTLRPALRKALSRVPDNLVRPDTFVDLGDSVAEKNFAVIKRNIETAINSTDPQVRPPAPGYVALTDAQRDAIEKELDAQGTVDAAIVEAILNPGVAVPKKAGPVLVYEDPLLDICRPHSPAEECADAAFEQVVRLQDGRPVPSDRAGSGVAAIEISDIPTFVARLIDTMTSPEEALLTNLEPRADRAQVQQNLAELALRPSPADTPAFYEFHHVQMAFESVWQEAIDEGLLDLAEDAYQDIVELGGDPDGQDAANGGFLVLQREAKRVLTARRTVNSYRRDRGESRRRSGTCGQGRDSRRVRDHRDRNRAPESPLDRLPEVLSDLEERLKEDYAFTVFGANRKERSVNFGIVVTYLQKWEPLEYQAGKLAKTVTLAPKETKKYSKKTTFHRKRAEKEIELHARTRRDESSQTSRAEQEIVRKALVSTNFELQAQGTYKLPIAEGTSTTTFSRKADQSSDQIKKAFHEAVFKSAQEYKDEQTTEVTTEESMDEEIVESGEITNPNDELAVTFLFYELQRRYRVSERIHRLTPVIFVAQEVPRPDEIDEAWVLTYDWIIRRALLDDSFIPALDYLTQRVVGDRVAIDQLGVNVEQQREIVCQLQEELAVARERLAAQRVLLERALFQRARVVSRSRDDDGPLSSIPIVGDIADAAGNVIDAVGGAAGQLGEFLFGGEGEAGGSRQDALKEAMERSAEEARDLLFRLEREVTALNDITEKYSKAIAEHLNHRTHIARLLAHLRQNIFHYMQAIWSYEPPHQRFFRLHQVPVPVLKANARRFTFAGMSPADGVLAAPPHKGLGADGTRSTRLYPLVARTEVSPEFETVPLVEVADLDKVLGFQGNYMMFALKESNALTDFMMRPYVVAGFDQLTDPDDLANWTIEDFAKYVCCLKEKLPPEQFELLREQLHALYKKLLSSPRRNGDVLTVPTSSLFIEALVANSSLIERFKEQHRIMDVKMVQAQVRQRELDNLRYAARLLAGEREDPEIERKIVVEGGATSVIVPPVDH